MGMWVLGLAIQTGPLSIVNALINTSPILIFFIEAVFYKVKFISKKETFEQATPNFDFSIIFRCTDGCEPFSCFGRRVKTINTSFNIAHDISFIWKFGLYLFA